MQISRPGNMFASQENSSSAATMKEEELRPVASGNILPAKYQVSISDGGGVAALIGGGVSTLATESRKRLASGRAGAALRGGAWTIAEYTATQILRTVATLVLARHFLSPEAFGVVGLATVFISGLAMFSELGIVVNIVQHPRGDDPEFLNTAFSIQAMRGFALWAAAALAAYPLARFYNEPLLFPLLLVAALSEGIRGLTSTAAWTLKRHMRLRNISILAITSELAAFAVGILWAMASPSPWALVARMLTGALVYVVGSHLITQQAVRFRWEKSGASAILKFGGWISLSTAAYFLGGQGERLILGKFITPAELGCFSLALVIAAVPGGAVGQLVNQIFLPMISRSVRSSHDEAVRDFRRFRLLFLAIALFAAAGFLVCSKPLINSLLRPEYRMAGWMLQALGLRVAIDLFTAPATALILANGKSAYAAAANATRLVFAIAGIWIAFALFGLREAIIALLIAQAFSYLPLIFGLRKLLPGVAWRELCEYALLLFLLAVGGMFLWARQ